MYTCYKVTFFLDLEASISQLAPSIASGCLLFGVGTLIEFVRSRGFAGNEDVLFFILLFALDFAVPVLAPSVGSPTASSWRRSPTG